MPKGHPTYTPPPWILPTFDNPRDEWGHYLYTFPNAELPLPNKPPKGTNLKEVNTKGKLRWRIVDCLICGQKIYQDMQFATGRPRKYHDRCKPTKNNHWGKHPDAPGEKANLADRKYNFPICGANLAHKAHNKVDRNGNTPDNTICLNPAGWGTDHTGYGPCKRHLGNTHSGRMMALKQQMFGTILGDPADVDPITAIQQEVQRTAGHVEWLRALITSVGMDPNDPRSGDNFGSDWEPIGQKATLFQQTMNGLGPSAVLNLYLSERKHLVDVCQAAVKMGVQQKAIELIEGQARLLAMTVMAILEDPELALSPTQRALAPAIVRRHLLGVAERQGQENIIDIPVRELEESNDL